MASRDLHAEASRTAAFAGVVDWLAGLLLAPPPVATIAGYRSEQGAALLDAIGAEFGCAEGIDRMRAALLKDASPEHAQRRLSIAYTTLFEGAGGGATVPPYESAFDPAFRDAPPRLFGPATGEMEALLKHTGWAPGRECREPPDHAAIELALLALLLREGGSAGAAALLARLQGWLPRFAQACRARDPDGFYGGVAQVLEALFAGAGAAVTPRDG